MTSLPDIHVLSGGAAQGLIARLQTDFQAGQPGQGACSLVGNFGAVGVMKDRLLSGEACDVIILTQALIEQLTASGHVVEGSAQVIGAVKTGIAVKATEVAPHVDTPDALKAALLAATGIYFPDPVKATAGIHFMKVLKELGIDTVVSARLRPFPNGASAMGEMSKSSETGLMGCTQVTEIIGTPGVKLVARLPREFELVTLYTAAICTNSAQVAMAASLIELLGAEASSEMRKAAGFE